MADHIRLQQFGAAEPKELIVRMRCPRCKHKGTFESGSVHDVLTTRLSDDGKRHLKIALGSRRCPDPECFTHVFVVGEAGRLVASYPSEELDFDSTDLPEAVLACIEESVRCHAAQCYVAAAIMIRKALEEVCRDRGASGANLKKKIASLGSHVLLPAELLDGMDELRLLGNDAAHVESRTFESIGKNEVEVSLEFAKEILKAVYQYESLLRQLRSLKRDS